MTSIADQLQTLSAPKILIKAARAGKITRLECQMPGCFCPPELGGRAYFDATPGGQESWRPTNDHYPVLRCDDGKETVDNSRLAHRLCNRVDYKLRNGIPVRKDLARAETAISRD